MVRLKQIMALKEQGTAEVKDLILNKKVNWTRREGWREMKSRGEREISLPKRSKADIKHIHHILQENVCLPKA